MNRIMSRLAPRLTAVMLASWLLLMLQPCCEVIAAAIPHDHAAAAGTHAAQHGSPPPGHHSGTAPAGDHGDHHSGHNTTPHSNAGHLHCGDGNTRLSHLPDVVVAKNRLGVVAERPDVISQPVGIKPAHPVLTFKEIYSPAHAPPSLQKTYLKTLRLRI
jgi:hypothetical protein